MVGKISRIPVMHLRKGSQILFNGSIYDVLNVQAVSQTNDPDGERALLTILGLEDDSYIIEINCHETTPFDMIVKRAPIESVLN